MKDEGRVGSRRWLLFWSIAVGGTAFDLVTKSIVFSRIGPPPAQPHIDHPQDPRAAHQRKYRCTLGIRRRPAGQQPDLCRAFGRGRGRDLLLPLRAGGSRQPGVDRRSGPDHGRRDGQLLRPTWSSGTCATSCTSTSMRSTSIAPSSTSPITCSSSARARWCSTRFGPRSRGRTRQWITAGWIEADTTPSPPERCPEPTRAGDVDAVVRSIGRRGDDGSRLRPPCECACRTYSPTRRSKGRTRTGAGERGSFRLRGSACTRSRCR